MYQTVHRRLELAFVFQGIPFAWRCSICGKLFAASTADLTPELISDISREFRVHACYPLLEIEQITELDRRLVPSSLKIRKEP
ncbi:MAG: hypothetical protein ROO76_14785 [Terriglobia bacterium]|jgi:hypothetical protein|nr:hypothetical protein [Terriglobia bacterium]